MATRANTVLAGRVVARPAARTLTGLVGAVFLLVGVLGFIPGVTTDYYDLRWFGHESGAMLFGVFQVSVVHNVVHLLYGLVGLAMSRTVAGSRAFLIVGGALYLVLWLYGMIVDHASFANVIPINNADNWLHLGLGLGMIGLGLLTTRSPASPARTGVGRLGR